MTPIVSLTRFSHSIPPQSTAKRSLGFVCERFLTLCKNGFFRPSKILHFVCINSREEKLCQHRPQTVSACLFCGKSLKSNVGGIEFASAARGQQEDKRRTQRLQVWHEESRRTHQEDIKRTRGGHRVRKCGTRTAGGHHQGHRVRQRGQRTAGR